MPTSQRCARWSTGSTATARWRRLQAKLLYIEQPMPREITGQSPLGALAERDFIIDEADDSYRRISGGAGARLSRHLLEILQGNLQVDPQRRRAPPNGARTARQFFITGEDLTCQAGLAVQQDLALGALIGVTHAERNGHHYVDGFGEAPAAEAQAFLSAHPDLYARDGNSIRLAIHDGDLLTGSLTAPGFATRRASGLGRRCRRSNKPTAKIPREQVT